MKSESLTVFTLAGLLQKGDNNMDGRGKLAVVDKGSPITPMPYGSFWSREGRTESLSLGLSSADYVWQVLFVALTHNFCPDRLDTKILSSIQSDTELKAYLINRGVEVANVWAPTS